MVPRLIEMGIEELNRRFLGAICLAIVAGYFAVGLWPFQFAPRNNVAWLEDSAGIHFDGRGTVYSLDPLTVCGLAEWGAGGAVTLELLLRPESEKPGGIGHIFALYDGNLPVNLLVGQWKSEILIRAAQLNSRGERRYHEIGAARALQKDRTCFLAITSGASGTVFYVDGIPVKSYPRFVLQCGNLAGRIILGSSPTGGGNWSGNLLGAAVIDRALDSSSILRHFDLWCRGQLRELGAERGLAALYVFDERAGRQIKDLSGRGIGLAIPEVFPVLRKIVLSASWDDLKPNLSHIEDVAINIFGFVPFGVCFFLYWSGARENDRFNSAWLAILLGGVISLSIELIQVFLPARHSSLLDLICNISGTALGVSLAASRLASRLLGSLEAPRAG